MTGAAFWQATSVSLITGAQAGTGMVGAPIAALLSAGANVATQLAQGDDSIKWKSVGVSALASLAGSAAGGVANKFLHLTQPVINQSVQFVNKSGEYSSSIVTNAIGGVVGFAAEMAGQRVNKNSTHPTPVHRGTFGENSSSMNQILNTNATPVSAF